MKEMNTNKMSETKLNGFPAAAEKTQDKEETNSTGEENARTPSPQEELEELNAELEVIQDDSKYVEFLEKCHHMKDEKSVVLPEEDQESDPDFDAEKFNQKLFEVVKGQINEKRRENEETDSDENESDSSSDDDEEEESFLEVDEKQATISDLKVPKDLKEKNAKAFPPFWRLKRQMEILDSKKGETEDLEDPDFVQKEDIEIDSDSSDSDSSSEDEEGEDGNDTSVTAVKAAEEEEDMGEDELANLVEELKINEVNMEDFEGEEDQEEDEGKEETAEAAAPEEVWYDAVNKDQSGYQSGDDPDYEVPEGAIQVVDLSSDSEDSEEDNESEMEEEAQRME